VACAGAVCQADNDYAAGQGAGQSRDVAEPADGSLYEPSHRWHLAGRTTRTEPDQGGTYQ
jgi:hypothetical protein